MNTDVSRRKYVKCRNCGNKISTLNTKRGPAYDKSKMQYYVSCEQCSGTTIVPEEDVPSDRREKLIKDSSMWLIL